MSRKPEKGEFSKKNNFTKKNRKWTDKMAMECLGTYFVEITHFCGKTTHFYPIMTHFCGVLDKKVPKSEN